MRRRIAAIRWPSKESVSDRSQGVPLATLQELARVTSPHENALPLTPRRRAGSLCDRRRPTGFATFPGEIWRTPRGWVEASYPNVIYFHEVDKGGHFAAWEEPELFSAELRAAFGSLR